jgi:glycosyltransferase involved in cell wall biosynthesis
LVDCLLAFEGVEVKLRVLEVLPTLRLAGAERIAVSLVCGLPHDRFEAGVVSLYDPFPQGHEPILAAQKVPTWHLGKRPGLDPRIWARLARVFREFCPDVLHTHSYVLRYVLPVAGRARIVHSLHNLAGRDPDRVTAVLNYFAFRRGVVPVAVSSVVARSFEVMYRRAPCAAIPNGIDSRRFAKPEARGPWRRANGFGDEDILIASVARLEPQKDPETLIAAFARVVSGRERCHLLLAGDGRLRGRAESLSGRLGLSARVRFLGQQNDVSELLCAVDIFALASRWEGHPVSVMEAMAAGLPVVATRVGGVPDLVEEGVSGLLVPPGDPAALGQALACLADAPPRRRSMAKAAKLRGAGFSADRMVTAYADLFVRVVEGTS